MRTFGAAVRSMAIVAGATISVLGFMGAVEQARAEGDSPWLIRVRGIYV
ncbi:MAG: hypothetical protein P1U84_05645 [Parvibaculaceae bacterium]|nr:hypothetical protein [Parvibaculaceae bacterium]